MLRNYFQVMLRLSLFVLSLSAFSQSVSYSPPSYYQMGEAITPLVPNQTFGTINGGTYRQVSLFAGTGTSGSTNTTDPLTSTFGSVRGIVKDAKGNYYVAEADTGKRIRKISANGTVTTVYQFTDFVPRDLAINTSNGDLYIIIHSHRLLKISNSNAANYPAQDPVYSYVNDATNVVVGSSSPGNTDATGTAARLNNPFGIAMAPDNTYLLIADTSNDRIRKVMLSNFAVTTFSGSSTGATNGILANAKYTNPADIVIVNDNLMYVTEAYNGNRIRKIDTGVVSTFVGGSFDSISFDGNGSQAFIDQPHSVTVDGLGNLYVVEKNNHKIRKITPDGIVTTIAGTLWNNSFSGNTNDNGNNARFNNPEGVFYDADNGFLLVSDTGNYQIRKVQLAGFSILPAVVAGMQFNTATGVFSGTPTAASLKTQYVQNFDTNSLGTVNGTDVAISGNAVVRGSTLILNQMNASQLGGIVIPATGENSNLLKVAFDVITIKNSGGADGISYSFAPDAVATATSTAAEIGTGTKLSVSFADFSANRGIRLFYNPNAASMGTSVNTQLLAYSNNTSWISKVAKVVVSVSEDGKLTLTLDGVVIFNAVQLPADYLSSNKATWKHVFKARTGGSNDLHAIDNVAIQQGLGATNHTIVARNYNVERSLNATINVADSNMVASVSQTNNTCYGDTNGTALVTVTSGVPPFTYSWSPSGGSSATATGLASGTYTCTITGANGTTIDKVITIGPDPIVGSTSTINTCGSSYNWFTSEGNQYNTYTTSGIYYRSVPNVGLVYCDATGGGEEYIGRVVIGNINNNSDNWDGYDDRTDLSTTVTAGSSYNINVSVINAYETDLITAWADWNQDGDFDDLGEQYNLPFVYNSGSGFRSITVPAGAYNGNVRLRVRLLDGDVNTMSSCDGSDYGEVEDYTLVVSGGATPPVICPTYDKLELTLNPIPAAPTVSDQTFSGSATVADLVATGANLKWYYSVIGGSPLATSIALVTRPYFVTQTINNCESIRFVVYVTVNTTPAPTAPAQTFCSGTTVADLVATGTDLKWYAVATGGTALATTTPLATGIYYVSQTVSGSESPRSEVEVLLNTTPAPTVPIAPNQYYQTLCHGTTIADLVATGTDLKWYAVASGGTALATTTVIDFGINTFYVTQTVNGCESARTSVVIGIATIMAPSASPQTFCNGATVANLVALNNNTARLAISNSNSVPIPLNPYKWYTTSTGGTSLDSSTALATGTYYVSFASGGCESARTAVAVTVNTTVAPTASAQTFCSGATVADLLASGTSLQWYAANTGGTVLETSATLSTGTYYVSQTLNSCESTRTSVVVTVDAPAVSGTISGGSTVFSGTNSTILTLSGYTGSIQWQSSNALAGTYTDIGGATEATYTATNLTATTYYRAVVSNGVCSPEISSPATITVSLINPNLSKVIDSQCGATLSAINTLIYANAVSGASGYRFKVVFGTTTEIVEATSGRWFRLTSLPGGAFYNTIYTISVSVRKNNVWGDYGDACTVTTPIFPATEVQTSQCGVTLASIVTTISANPVANATGYKFKVVYGVTTETIETYSARWFRLTSLPSGALYNTIYSISVATKYNGVWGDYGDECTVTTPAFPITKVQDSQCGITLASLATTISANAVTNVTGFRFKVVNQTTEETIEAVSGSRWFRLTSLTGGASYNTTYTVSVATRYNGIWSEYGEECLITTPAAPLTKLQDRQCGTTLNSGNTSLLYATAVSVAQKYRFEVSLGADVYTYDTASSSVRSFRMTAVPGLTLARGTTYTVRVAIMANGVWQPYGEPCTITTYSITPNVVKTMNVETTKLAIIDFNVVTYPNPFTENFNLSLTSISEEKVTVMVYDMTGKLLEKKEVIPSELSELQVGNNFASGVYNVIVSQGEHTKSLRVIKK